jgi:PAS domain S-box-containing protein
MRADDMRSNEESTGAGADADRATGAEPRDGGLLMIPIATALIAADGRILHWSPDAELLLGHTAREAVGAFAADLLATEPGRPEVLALFAGILAGEPWSGEYRVRHRDGHLVNLEFRTYPISGPDGLRLVLAVASDVGAVRRVEADLAVLDSFFTQSPVGMAVYDNDLRFVRLNAALARINGVPAERHLGRRTSEVLPGPEGEEIEALVRRVLESGDPIMDVRSHSRKGGQPTQERAWSASYFRLEEPNGRILGVSSTIVEVTARYRAESRATRSRERLELLVDAGSRIGTTLDLEQTARELAGTMVPRVADLTGVFVLERLLTDGEPQVAEPGGAERVRRLALAGSDPSYPTAALPTGEVYLVPPGSPYAGALATGRTVVVPARELMPLLPASATGQTEADTAGTDAATANRTEAGSHPVRVTPLVARGAVLGMVVYSRRDERDAFDGEDITLGDELAARAAAAIENAQLYLREHKTLVARQQALREANAAQERLALVNEASTRIGSTLDLSQTALELAEVATPQLADTVVVEVLESLVRGEEPGDEPGRTDRSAVLRRLAFHNDPASGMEPLYPVGDVLHFPPTTPYAWCLANRRPVLIPRLDDDKGMKWFVDDPQRQASILREGVHCLMVVPLIARGSVVGVASFYRTATQRRYDEADLALAAELSARAAVSIDNALLYTRERDASRARLQALDEAHAAQERVALLNDASSRIGTTLDLQRTAEELIEVVIPRFADFATVDLLESVMQGGEQDRELPPVPDSGTVLLRAVAVGELGQSGLTSTVDQLGQTTWSAKVYAESLRSGRSILVPEVDAAELYRIVTDPSRVQPGLDAGIHSYLMVPLLARGTVLGGAEFIRMGNNPEPFDSDDRALAEELAARAAVCIDNARLYRRERDTALTLQRSLLPQEVHRTPGLEIAYRYLPSSVVSEVGGDWFDVVPLTSGRVALVVGDVMGHGIRAAATMGQLRTAARTLITMDLTPDQLLRRLDETASAIGEGQFATCICAVFDPADRSCTVACAGHPPPVVTEPGGSTRLLEVPAGAPLGVGGVPFESTEFTLPEESVLVLYTDGLVERRGRDLDEGLDLLSGAVARRNGSLEQDCDAVLAAMSAGDSDDDIAVIMARVLPAHEDWIATLPLSADLSVVGEARRFARATLASWGLASLSEFTELLVSELVSNALRHAGQPTQLRLFRDRVLTVEVADVDEHAPRLHRAEADDEGGRGMHLVNELAHRWGSRTTRHGKVVWLELELPLGFAH